MSIEQLLDGIAKNVTPSDRLKQTIKARMEARIQPQSLLSAVSNTSPSKKQALSLKAGILGRLQPIHVPAIHTGFKWAATFALILLAVRALPIVLAPTSRAEIGVQLVPNGEEVSIYIGGVWREVTEPQVITSAVMIQTGDDSSATLIVNDDALFRLGPDTTFRLHGTGDRPHYDPEGAAATFIRGELWALGFLPPIVEGLVIETSQGTISLNTGSVSVEDQDDGSVKVAVYDRGTTVTNSKQTVILVTGEKTVLKEGKTFSIQTMPASAFDEERVKANLLQDAVHRVEIAKLIEERRVAAAGILPTNALLYQAKRVAEEVDVLFTLTQDGRTEKRIAQANTRLNEALALIENGEGTQAAAGPISEYRDSLVALAASEDDNLVKYLIKKQIADASISLSGATEDPSASVELLTNAVAQVGSVIPDTDLKMKDVEGYVLVDRLAQINQMLTDTGSSSFAASKYAEISPYLSGLLTNTGGAHPLLQKEARSLLVSTSTLLKKADVDGTDELFMAMESDVAKYLPPEPEKVEELNAELDAEVKEMIQRIVGNLGTPGGRYNQLLVEMDRLRKHPHRGTLLRRLKAALPERLGEYVNTEIQKFSDELKGR